MHKLKRLAAIIVLALLASMGTPQALAGNMDTPTITGDIQAPGINGIMDTPAVTGEISTPGLNGDILCPGVTGEIPCPGLDGWMGNDLYAAMASLFG